MKRILLFITATLLLASGTSCSDDNTNFDPIVTNWEFLIKMVTMSMAWKFGKKHQ